MRGSGALGPQDLVAVCLPLLLPQVTAARHEGRGMVRSSSTSSLTTSCASPTATPILILFLTLGFLHPFFLGGGRDSARRHRAPGPHAHRNTARQATDGLWTEAHGQQTQSNDPGNNQHIFNTPTIGRR